MHYHPNKQEGLEYRYRRTTLYMRARRGVSGLGSGYACMGGWMEGRMDEWMLVCLFQRRHMVVRRYVGSWRKENLHHLAPEATEESKTQRHPR